jgi:acetyl-CoA synthetase (ADP-forming)
MSKKIKQQLEPLFSPKSVALVGISRTATNVAYMFLQNLLNAGFAKVYPVNPKGGELLGVKVYPSIKDIPGEIDLALVTVPRSAVLGVTRECAAKGIKGMVLYTGGFSESGPEGRRFEQEMVKIARKRGTRVVGPNCVGTYNPSARLIPQAILPKESGPVGVISHSGFLFYYLLMSINDAGLKPSKGVSCGSDCDLTCVDFLEYLGQDPGTKIIVAYLEGIRDGERLMRVAREISPKKPIIVLKGGNTDAGRRASASHTGTLAVPTAIWKALCSQAGIISVDSFEQMMDTLVALHHLPSPKGRRVGIITTPGGLAVTSTDACNELGLEIPQLSAKTQKELAAVIAESVGTSVTNPVDLGLIAALSPDNYIKNAISIVAKDPNIDMILTAFTGPPFDDDVRDRRVADILLKAIADGGKPAVICGATPQGWPRGELRFLAQSNVPVYPEPKRAAYALAKLVQYSEFLRSVRT